jgi:hypothetical protein
MERNSKLGIGISLFLICSLGKAQKDDFNAICRDAMVYENRNQVDYGPLKTIGIRGQAVLDNHGFGVRSPVPHACISLFGENNHEWIVTTIADDKGNYSFKGVKPGQYRLVARSNDLYSANVPILVIEPKSKSNFASKRIVIHFTFIGTHGNSFGSLE